MADQEFRSLADPEQTRLRAEILNQFFHGMLLLNGGGCIALLAFLQAIWNGVTASFIRVVVIGMTFFLFGLTLTTVGQYIRYRTSLALQFGAPGGRSWQRAHSWSVWLSVAAFLVGSGVVAWGLFSFAAQ